MAFDVRLTDLPTLQIGSADVQFSVRTDEHKVGTLLVSKGGIEWRPTLKQRRRLTWAEFDRIMREHWGD